MSKGNLEKSKGGIALKLKGARIRKKGGTPNLTPNEKKLRNPGGKRLREREVFKNPRGEHLSTV